MTRLRLRFSLRTLLAFATAVAVLFAISHLRRQWVTQRVNEFVAEGVTFYPLDNGWLDEAWMQIPGEAEITVGPDPLPIGAARRDRAEDGYDSGDHEGLKQRLTKFGVKKVKVVYMW